MDLLMRSVGQRSHDRSWARSISTCLLACVLSALLFGGTIPMSERDRLSAFSRFSTMSAMACDPFNCLCVNNWDNCTGQDPNVIGCNAPFTVAESISYKDTFGRELDTGQTQNRYATNCRSNWGRTFSDRYTDPMF